MQRHDESLRVLHLLISVGETSAAYNEHCLPLVGRRRLAICTFFKPSVPTPAEIRLFSGNGTVRGFWGALRRALAAGEYDVIHAHSPHVALVFLLVALFRRRVLRSSVFTVHNSYENFKPRNRLMLLPIFATFQRVVCCGEASLQSFPWLYRRLAGRRLCAVQNGMDVDRVDRIAPSRPTDSTEKPATIISVGRLIDIKNPLLVLDAFAQVTDQESRLVFIGTGHLQERLEYEIERRGLQDRVELAGLVPRDEVYMQLAAADVFISTSRGEGLPVAVMEAMACRTPVVLSDIPPHAEIAGDSHAVSLQPMEDAERFASELNRLLALTPDERTELGEACRQIIEEQFSLQAMHRRYPQVYAEVHGKPIDHEDKLTPETAGAI